VLAAVTTLAAGPAQAGGFSHPVGVTTIAAPRLTADTNAPCNVTPKPGYARCFAIVRTPASHEITAAAAQDGPPSTALAPADIQSAYHLPGTGSGQTVAIVDAYGDSSAESDLAAFRAHYGLPACSTANGCFRKVDQAGGTSYPADNSSWALETSLDLDAVSAACPACNILLVEGNTASIADLAAAENEAAALGAKYISNSYGASEDPSLVSYDSAYQHPGVAVTVSTGDTGNIVSWPSSNPDVTAVGGTTLTLAASSSRGWAETAWDSGGSGCSTIEPQPQYQVNVNTDCAMRATADVSADANPASGLGIYDTLGYGGWLQVGGTSLASPLMASVYALAGAPVAGTYPVNYPYHDPTQSVDLFDITQGSDGFCGNLLCNAGTGWDGPTGLGSPDGVSAFSGGPQGTITGQVTDATTGKPVSGVTVTASPGNYATRTDSSGDYALDVAAGTYRVSATLYAYQTGASNGVQVPANGTATANFTLTELPHATVSGTVTDGSGHGWPLYAKITIGGGYPGGPIYTNPFTGQYSVTLAGPATYPVKITSAEPAVLGSSDNGYQEQNVQLSVGTTTVSQNFSLQVDKSACTAPGYGPAGLSENFTGWTGAAPGAGWTVSGTTAGWRFDNPGSRPAPGDSITSDSFAIADSGTSGGRMDTMLTSPVVDLSGQSAPAVSFTSGYYGGSGQQAQVDLSTDNGRTWSTVWRQGTDDSVGPVNVPIPQAAGESRVRVRFRYSGDDAWWWAVGDVLVGTPGCVALPGGLVTGLVTDHGTSGPVDGATVTSVAGGTGVAAGTSDPAVPGGLYQLFSPAGSQRLTAAAGGYTSAAATVDVAASQLTRQDWALTAGTDAARTAALTSAVKPAATPARAPALKPLSLPGLHAPSYTITLITGDQVRLTATGHGEYSVAAVPSPDASPDLQVSVVATKKGISILQAMPSSAAGLLAGGQLDRGLFDLEWLVRHGDTGPGTTLPVVLHYGGHPDAATLTHDAGALPGATVASVSVAGGTARVNVATGHAAAFWNAITGQSASRPGAVSTALAAGIARVWLADHQEGTSAAQPAANGQPLYTVIETVEGSSDKSRWCSASQSLCISNSFSLVGVTGEGADRAYPATSLTCASGTSPCTAYQVTYSVPVGTYMSGGFADFKQGPDLQELDLTVPQVTVAGDTGFTVNANSEKKITIGTPRPSFPVAVATEDYRLTPDGTIATNLQFVAYGYQNIWVIPSQPVSAGAFDFSSAWILYAPTLSMSVVAPEHLTLQPEYPFYAVLPGKGFTLFTGSGTLPMIDAGIGSAQDFSQIDARGKLALIRLDPAVGGCEVESSQLQNAVRAGAAGVIADPALPPSVGTGSCWLPVIPQSFAGQGPQVNIPFASIPATQATALESMLARGAVRIRVAALASSPYQYDLKFYSEGKLPSATEYAVTGRTLTAVHTSYHSAQAAVAEPNDLAWAPDEYFVAGVGDGLPAPAAQTEYYGPVSPAVAWSQNPDLLVGGNAVAFPLTWDVFGHGGGSLTEDWFDSPATLGSVAPPEDVFQAQPGKFDSASSETAGCAACRQGDVFYPLFYQVSGADPRLIDGPYLFAPGSVHLFQGGQEIQPVSVDGFATYPLPAQRGSYQLTAAYGDTSTDWRFTSAEPASNQVPDGFGCAGTFLSGSTAPCAPDPLIFLRYNAFTTLANAVTAGTMHQVQVTPSYQASVAPAEITSLKLWISTDGGSTWQQEKVQENDGRYTASYYVPELSATSGTVSVRVQAADSAGDSVSQTIDDAYTITS
jgi:hypothetical protein